MNLISGGQDVTTFTGDERAQAVYFLRLFGKHLANCVRRVDITKRCTCGFQSSIDKVRGTPRNETQPGPMF